MDGLTLSSSVLTRLARESGFSLVGFARAEPLPAEPLETWLSLGYGADMDWLGRRKAERLDVSLLLPGARTVVALACNYHHGDEPSPVARYARGRDYHATLRDRLRAFRRVLRERYPSVKDYGGIDSGPFMEKVWAVKAGLGFVARNGCLVTAEYGSWVVLAVLVLDAAVDVYAGALVADACGRCRICLDACPTAAIDEARRVDARRCLSFQTIENEGEFPLEVRAGSSGVVFGCDICEDVCPLNATPVRADARFEPRALAQKSLQEWAQLSQEDYAALVPGSPLGRAGYDGLRRNAAYALGAARDASARPALERLARDASPVVSAAAAWALAQLPAAQEG